MIHIVTLALLLFGQAAHAQPATPSCWLVTQAAGYTMGRTAAGQYAAWWCPDAWGDWNRVTLVMRAGYTLIHPTVAATASPASTAAAYWRANVQFSCAVPRSNDPPMLALCDAAANAANETKPPPPFVVRSNGLATTRPTYPLVAGVRGLASNGTVRVLDAGGRPTACNPAQAAGSYMQVKRTPGTVALCSATP